MTKQPWMKFYPSDWRADPRLRMCGLAARGLWMEMLAIMHEATPYGHLLISGISPTDAQLAVLAGASSDQITGLIGELEAAGVFSRTRLGAIYSRRMTKDSKKADLARKNGKCGGNPTLCNPKDNTSLDNLGDKGGVKAQKPEARVQKKEERERPPPPDPTPARPQQQEVVGASPDEFEAVLDAAGIDWRNDLSGKWLASTPRWNVDRWLALGLTHAEVLIVAAESRPKSGAPGSLAYFDQAMQRAAGRKNADPLKPIAATKSAEEPAEKKRAAWRRMTAGFDTPNARRTA